jgi:hypothetical protein
MALMDVFTHFSIIRRERRGIRPEEIKFDFLTVELLTFFYLHLFKFSTALSKLVQPGETGFFHRY